MKIVAKSENEYTVKFNRKYKKWRPVSPQLPMIKYINQQSSYYQEDEIKLIIENFLPHIDQYDFYACTNFVEKNNVGRKYIIWFKPKQSALKELKLCPFMLCQDVVRQFLDDYEQRIERKQKLLKIEHKFKNREI
jgi:hypothetical protein